MKSTRIYILSAPNAKTIKTLGLLSQMLLTIWLHSEMLLRDALVRLVAGCAALQLHQLGGPVRGRQKSILLRCFSRRLLRRLFSSAYLYAQLHPICMAAVREELCPC